MEKITKIEKIGILGAGAFGTAMAAVARRAGREVMLWAYEAEIVDAINMHHTNEFLSGVELDPGIRATQDLRVACDVDAVLIAVPTVYLRSIVTQAAAHWPTGGQAGVPALICSKGVEQDSCKLMADVVRDCLGADAVIASMGGPTFAKEIARDLPSATTLACADLDVANRLATALSSPHFRIYTTQDTVGTQLGGAAKNVLAIACGIVTGMGLGDNARAALITRGLAEINALGQVLGANSQTLMGLSGLGDLTLTCNATQSRNFSLGFRLGQGEMIDTIMGGSKTIAEGYYNAQTVTELARRNQVDMPICLAVEAVLNVDADLESIIHGLLSRPLVSE